MGEQEIKEIEIENEVEDVEKVENEKLALSYCSRKTVKDECLNLLLFLLFSTLTWVIIWLVLKAYAFPSYPAFSYFVLISVGLFVTYVCQKLTIPPLLGLF